MIQSIFIPSKQDDTQIRSDQQQQQTGAKTVLKSSPEFQIAVNSAADCKIITDAQDVNPVRKLSLNSST